LTWSWKAKQYKQSSSFYGARSKILALSLFSGQLPGDQYHLTIMLVQYLVTSLNSLGAQMEFYFLMQQFSALSNKMDEFLAQILTRSNTLMATVQDVMNKTDEVLAEVRAEREQVQALMTAQADKLQELTDALASSGSVTPDQLSDVVGRLQNITDEIRNISEPLPQEPAPVDEEPAEAPAEPVAEEPAPEAPAA
jgi:methyl-accepting chemotaxis protein